MICGHVPPPAPAWNRRWDRLTTVSYNVLNSFLGISQEHGVRVCVRYQPGRVGLTGEAGSLCSLPARRAGPHCHVFRPDAGTGEKSVSRTRTQAASHRLAIGSESVPKIIINDTINMGNFNP